jgi:hypothetical protein
VQLADYERQVMPLWTRFSSAATGRETQESANAARARTVRNLPVPTQVALIKVAQGARDIVEALSRRVPCPVCNAKVGDACATAQTADQEDMEKRRLRKVSHPERLEAARAQFATERETLTDVARAQAIGTKAREVFIFSHSGYVMQRVKPYVASFDSESERDAILVLRQEAYNGLNDAVDAYDPTYADPVSPAEQAARALEGKVRQRANPLTYGANKIRDRISTAIETGPLITAKSRAFDERQHVQAAAKAIENEGRVVSEAEIAERTKVDPQRVSQLLRSLTSAARLDQAMGEEGADDLGSIIADKSPGVEETTVSSAERDAVRAAASTLPPFQRRVIELGFELTDGESIEQKDLYDGVFIDSATGERLSAEGTVISDRRRRGEEVTKASQKELNRRFQDGELTFEAGTKESFELALLKRRAGEDEDAEPVEPTEAERLGRIITPSTGVPMTSGQIQDAKDNALQGLSEAPSLQSLRPRYRGDFELEQSLQARQMVRKALVIVGRISQGDAESVKAGRAAQDGSHQRGPLVSMAQEMGWVDPSNGRVDWKRLRADVASRKATILREREVRLADEEAEAAEDAEMAVLMSA